MKKSLRLILKILGSFLMVVFIAFVVWFISGEGVEKKQASWGVTFAPSHAQFLGLNPKEVFEAILDDMGAEHLRLMVPWNLGEKVQGVYDFSEVEWQVQEARKRGVTVTLAVGRKLFRWPECHDPEWIKNLPKDVFEQKVLDYLEASVNRFKQYDNITAWQIENEALLSFGDCGEHRPNWELFKKEVDLVRSLDNRSVISTESGELSAWLKIASQVDKLGVSLYRVTNNPFLGRFYYPFRPGFYQKKANFSKAINPNLDNVFISELQLEPWGEKPLTEMTLKEQFDWMSIDRARANIEFALDTGFDDIYIWGAEWWYWLKKNHNDNRFWDLGKNTIGGQI